MIKPLLVAAAMTLAATTLSAADVTPPTDKPNVLAFSVASQNYDIEYRHMFADSKLAVIAIAGYYEVKFRNTQTAPNFNSQDITNRFVDLGLGLRNNFRTGEQLRPFLQLDVHRSTQDTSSVDCQASPIWGYNATGGAEYFVGKQVSIEGSAGLHYGRTSEGCTNPNTGQSVSQKATTFGTFRSVVGINFYF